MRNKTAIAVGGVAIAAAMAALLYFLGGGAISARPPQIAPTSAENFPMSDPALDYTPEPRSQVLQTPSVKKEDIAQNRAMRTRHPKMKIAKIEAPLPAPVEAPVQAPVEQKPVQDEKWAPSFDCSKAQSRQDSLVCASRMLSEEDLQLSRLYGAAVASSPKKEVIKLEQLAWRMNQRNLCADAPCLEKAYTRRIDALRKYANPG